MAVSPSIVAPSRIIGAGSASALKTEYLQRKAAHGAARDQNADGCLRGDLAIMRMLGRMMEGINDVVDRMSTIDLRTEADLAIAMEVALDRLKLNDQVPGRELLNRVQRILATWGEPYTKRSPMPDRAVAAALAADHEHRHTGPEQRVRAILAAAAEIA